MTQILDKMVGRDGEHVSRFHTRQGKLGSLRESATAVPAAWFRLTRQRRGVPWLPPSAVEYLADHLRSDDVMLEFGGGASTAWFADRVGRLVTVEPSPEWSARISEAVSSRANVTVVTSAVRDALVDGATVVVVDHRETAGDLTRLEAVRWAAGQPTVRLVVLDDSDRWECATGLAESGWNRLVFRGFRPEPWRLTETTAYVRRTPTYA